MLMEIINSKAELAPILTQARLENKSIGLVPTMGALHVGHLSLAERSVKENDITICTIFVNPTQFNNSGDLVNYPRREEDDAEMLASTGCQIVFIPTVEDIYPPGGFLIFIKWRVGGLITKPLAPHVFLEEIS